MKHVKNLSTARNKVTAGVAVYRLHTLAIQLKESHREQMKPEVTKYLSAFQYLQDCYFYRKKQDPQFSYEVWAKELGASDKSYVRLIVFGKRPLNTKMSEAFIKNLELSAKDQEYFLTLVQYTQSKNREQRDIFGKKLMSLLKSDIDFLEIQSHYEFLSNPLLPRLQVFLSFHDLDQSPRNLAWLLGVSEEEVESALRQLSESRLIIHDGSRFRPAKNSFKVPDIFGDLGLKAFYQKNLQEAQEAIMLPKEERRFKSLFLPLNHAEFQKFLEGMEAYLNEQLIQYNPDEYADRRLYQVHFNVIPVSTKNSDLSNSAKAP